MFNGDNIREKICRSILKLFIYENVTPNKASLRYRKNMVIDVKLLNFILPNAINYQ